MTVTFFINGGQRSEFYFVSGRDFLQKLGKKNFLEKIGFRVYDLIHAIKQKLPYLNE